MSKMTAFPVSTMPVGPRRSGARLFYLVRMSDGSVRLFGSAGSAVRYLADNPSPSAKQMFEASMREAA